MISGPRATPAVSGAKQLSRRSDSKVKTEIKVEFSAIPHTKKLITVSVEDGVKRKFIVENCFPCKSEARRKELETRIKIIKTSAVPLKKFLRKV